MRKQILDDLVQKNILAHDEERLYWVIPEQSDGKLAVSSKFLLIERPPQAALVVDEIQAREMVLLTLVKACGLLDLVFFRDEKKLAARLISERAYVQAAKLPDFQTIQEIDAAIVEMIGDD